SRLLDALISLPNDYIRNLSPNRKGAEVLGSDHPSVAASLRHEGKEPMTAGIKDKIVVVTGASSGLGEATARLLSAEGATVVLGARRAVRLRTLVKELETRGEKALAVTTDVSQRPQVKALVDSAVQTYGRVDVMINNAGLMPQAPLERLKV